MYFVQVVTDGEELLEAGGAIERERERVGPRNQDVHAAEDGTCEREKRKKDKHGAPLVDCPPTHKRRRKRGGGEQ